MTRVIGAASAVAWYLALLALVPGISTYWTFLAFAAAPTALGGRARRRFQLLEEPGEPGRDLEVAARKSLERRVVLVAAGHEAGRARPAGG
jgi:membrane protein implicated in regulation of membrane protease activity